MEKGPRVFHQYSLGFKQKVVSEIECGELGIGAETGATDDSTWAQRKKLRAQTRATLPALDPTRLDNYS